MEIILNRWRGTGNIFSISIFNINGTMIYALYLGLLFGLITQWYIGIVVMICFFIGESFTWGKWVGSLCYPEKIKIEKAYENKKGYTFPYIHYIANFFIKEKVNYFKYCNLALSIRGLFWALIVYSSLFNGQGIINFFIININYIFNLNIDLLIIKSHINIFEYIFICLTYAIGFPIACYLSRKKSFSYKSKFISIVGKWESQEIYYGFIHFVCNAYIILKVVYGI